MRTQGNLPNPSSRCKAVSTRVSAASGLVANLRRELEFNAVSLVLAACDGALAHDAILLVSDSELLSLVLAVAIALLFFALPQLVANELYRSRKLSRAVALAALYAVVGVLLFKARIDTAMANVTGEGLLQNSSVVSLDFDMAGIMAFVMLANAVSGCFFRLSSLRAGDRARAGRLSAERDRLVAKQKAIAEHPEAFSFDRATFEKRVAREAASKRRLIWSLRGVYRDELAAHAIELFEDMEDARELSERLRSDRSSLLEGVADRA